MPVKVTIDKNWKQKPVDDINVGLLEIVTDGHSRSNILAPKDTRALVNSSRISPIADGYKVTYGSDRVPYARRQFFENKRSSYFLTKAFEAIMRSSLGKYFRSK